MERQPVSKEDHLAAQPMIGKPGRERGRERRAYRRERARKLKKMAEAVIRDKIRRRNEEARS